MKKHYSLWRFQFFGFVFGCATTGGSYQRPTAEQIATQRRQSYVDWHDTGAREGLLGEILQRHNDIEK